MWHFNYNTFFFIIQPFLQKNGSEVYDDETCAKPEIGGSKDRKRELNNRMRYEKQLKHRPPSSVANAPATDEGGKAASNFVFARHIVVVRHNAP